MLCSTTALPSVGPVARGVAVVATDALVAPELAVEPLYDLKRTGLDVLLLHTLHPRERVSVKQLRREGLGRLESADINRDGWVDAVDVQLFMQGRRSGGAPQRADIPRESGGVAW